MPVPRMEFQPSMAICTPMRYIPNDLGGERMEPITMEWHRSMQMLLMPTAYNVGAVRIDGYETGEARNMAVEKARAANMKYLMFIDADTILPQDGLTRLTYQLDNNPEYDIAAGFYCLKATPAIPLIWTDWGKGPHWDFTLGDVIKEGVVAVATGCMLLRLSLFDRLPTGPDDPWFCTAKGGDDRGEVKYQWAVSDDIFFCRRAVEEAGCKIIVDTNVYCRHIDWKTGRIYQLADDSLPVRRLAEKLGEAA